MNLKALSSLKIDGNSAKLVKKIFLMHLLEKVSKARDRVKLGVA